MKLIRQMAVLVTIAGASFVLATPAGAAEMPVIEFSESPASSAEFVSLEIRGDLDIAWRECTTLRAIAHYSDGTEVDVTQEARWKFRGLNAYSYDWSARSASFCAGFASLLTPASGMSIDVSVDWRDGWGFFGRKLTAKATIQIGSVVDSVVR